MLWKSKKKSSGHKLEYLEEYNSICTYSADNIEEIVAATTVCIENLSYVWKDIRW